jgi:hypothetical protein
MAMMKQQRPFWLVMECETKIAGAVRFSFVRAPGYLIHVHQDLTRQDQRTPAIQKCNEYHEITMTATSCCSGRAIIGRLGRTDG